MTAMETVRRMVRIAQGREQAGTAVDKDGNPVPVPFSDKVQWEAAKWQAERVLPPLANPNQPGTATTIYNQTTYVAAMDQLAIGMGNLTKLFGGPVAPGALGPGEVTSGTGEAGPPSMSLFMRKGRDQLIPKDDPITVVVDAKAVP
jgi:hypothetical protein